MEFTNIAKVVLLTSKWGIYQHGSRKQPDPSFGYAIDDQARALILVNELKRDDLGNKFFDFIYNAKDSRGNIYHYFYDSEDKIVPDKNVVASEDAKGMIIWALKSLKYSDSRKSIEILNEIFRSASKWQYPRSWAYALLGMVRDKDKSRLELLFTKSILDLFDKNSSRAWFWFEDILTYGNALVPWSLWEVGERRNNTKALETAEKATNFLLKMCQVDDKPAPIGNKGWYKKEGNRALYDQQPVDVSYMILCLESAYKSSGKNYYKESAKEWWNWFWGNNTKNLNMTDKDGNCFDGLNNDGVNTNQGAESTICYLLANLAAERLGIV